MKDYFAVFQMERQFSIDLNELDSRYRLLQKQFHPDRFVNQSAQQQKLAELASADINKGYNVLKKNLARAQHLLALNDHDTSLVETLNDKDLLMLQMERNEQLEEVKNTGELLHLQEQVKSDITESESLLAGIFDQDAVSKEQLSQAATGVQRLQFLTALLEKIDKKQV